MYKIELAASFLKTQFWDWQANLVAWPKNNVQVRIIVWIISSRTENQGIQCIPCDSDVHKAFHRKAQEIPNKI